MHREYIYKQRKECVPASHNIQGRQASVLLSPRGAVQSPVTAVHTPPALATVTFSYLGAARKPLPWLPLHGVKELSRPKTNREPTSRLLPEASRPETNYMFLTKRLDLNEFTFIIPRLVRWHQV
jgi:hypothetical protein